MEKTIIGCKWAGQLQKIEPDDYCHRCPFTLHSDECKRHRSAYQAVFVEGNFKDV